MTELLLPPRHPELPRPRPRAAGLEPLGPLDRAVLCAFAELVGAGRPVLDIGCGDGDVAAFVHSLGATVIGVDLVHAEVDRARRRHPAVQFTVGSAVALPVEDASVGGVVVRRALATADAARCAAVLAEVARVLAPGGHLLLGRRSTGQDDPGGAAELVRRHGFRVVSCTTTAGSDGCETVIATAAGAGVQP